MYLFESREVCVSLSLISFPFLSYFLVGQKQSNLGNFMEFSRVQTQFRTKFKSRDGI